MFSLVNNFNPWILVLIYTILFYSIPFIILLILSSFIKDKHKKNIVMISILIILIGIPVIKYRDYLKHKEFLNKNKNK